MTSSKITAIEDDTQWYFYIRCSNPEKWISEINVFDKNYFLTQPIS
jgi:hypothetical protein